nr:MAG TPA: hypothetical protein [Caudoviricetes sp.]
MPITCNISLTSPTCWTRCVLCCTIGPRPSETESNR